MQVDRLGEPLSWQEARFRLRRLLETYVKDPPPTRRARDEDRSAAGNESMLSKWISRDYDLYFGALFVSFALFVFSCFSLTAKLGGLAESELHPTASDGLYKSQLAASLVLVFGSCASLWMVRRRGFLSLNDTDYSKRREIFRFLRALGKHEENGRDGLEHAVQKIHLNGSSLNDIYPVYRRSLNSSEKGSWSRIPGLLIVRGDYLALQIGDIAPADCVLIHHDRLTSVRVMKGDRISLESIGQTSDQIMKDLPKGRTTLAPESEHLLTLCNRIRVVLVLRAPIEEFIYRPSVTSRPSQASRWVSAARQSLAVLSVFLLLATGIIVFSRSASAEDLSLLIPIPLLASIGVLPIVGPAFFFFLEALGTARILVAVHPHASSTWDDGETHEGFSQTRLLLRYMAATCLSRLSLWDLAQRIHRMLGGICPGLFFSRDHPKGSKLVRVPPASLNMLEKLGVATAFTLVDDALACEPHAIPQQLLIPSGNGLNLLDLCPTYDGDSDDGSNEDSFRHGKSFDSDSESDDGSQASHGHGILRRKILRRKKISRTKHREISDDDTVETTHSLFEVQFEEPTWWQYLPSLKCIGLSCLLLDENRSEPEPDLEYKDADRSKSENRREETRESALVQSVCRERQSKQLRSLAHCIGFSTHENINGLNGDISPFEERMRLHVLSTALIRQRFVQDEHERSSEWNRWWGLLRPDSTSIVVKDSRTKAFQMLTVGNTSVVVDLCQEAWQGESSTILPLGTSDRHTIRETTNSWKLADLDVAAFSYSPFPRSLEPLLTFDSKRQVYLLDHNARGLQNHPFHKDKTMSVEWSFMKNQIFLGVLGSLVVPRREIQNLLPNLSDAGVRFVYFSPRNMRRQKELASQMGIDVAWNCAISLRPLESGEEDPHRMVSNYADWDVNAKLPHGVEDVRKHLEEVDNVPLLVSLYTDVTKETTAEMVKIFQDYSDTVISVGLSHLTRNDMIFSVADIAVGIDTLTIENPNSFSVRFSGDLSTEHVLPTELEFVSSIAARSCVFRFRGASSVAHIASVIEKGRAALEAAVSASVFVLFGFLSFSFFVVFSVCVPSTVIPYIPVLGTVLFLQGVLPGLGFTMAMSNGDTDIMKRVPPKNDQNVTFARKEGWKLYTILILKAVPPALLPQLLHFITFGELLIHFEPEVVETNCPGAISWVDIVRCRDLKDYSGPAKISSGILVIAQLALCVAVSSAGFLSRMEPLLEYPPWKRNTAWLICLFLSIFLTFIYGTNAVSLDVKEALPWYFYLLVIILPILCLIWVEACKKKEVRLEQRAEKLRRLQFETRLGAWSPK